MKYSATVLVACGFLTVTGAARYAGAQTVQSAHREILLQSTASWNGKAYTHYAAGQPQLTTIRITLAPHTALPWHTHPMPNAGYVLKGQLTIHDKASGDSHTFHQGEAFSESVDDEHRGESGDAKTVVLLTYAGTPGMPTSVPAKGEKPEY
ncbi:cupin domain-containing protein [Acetobacter oeni]|uniref:Cupin type-2 domain-containing protein n=1 Tax=Acetobacter oeni TaxID=304077 RepID=A0A511XMY4_9PROT|nr:cupin domain-containing protein [Acetobacter oeni]MBB3881518.1 quercetin dioxygenase-like cupin family protein [Acetobacter oeni]NHO18381.1 cupin domain-containing protein [Acetobacter oeni]GBR10761.1 hypothetical protein AA21952_3153 [Acetobacter oeni LMG 21952]GEN64304.1 hypothetical protein AOE01nite_25280 [Acetobacter oeni]